MNGRVPLPLRRMVHNKCILPVMTYGAENLHLTEHLERKLGSLQQAMERKMIGVMLRERKQAPWIRERTRVEDIIVEIMKKKWAWAEPVMRRNDNWWATRVTESGY